MCTEKEIFIFKINQYYRDIIFIKSQITCFPLHWGSVQPDLTCGVNIANTLSIIPGTKIML